MEVLKMPLQEEDEEKGEEYELCLELSIGGRYAKSGNSRGKTMNMESVGGGRNENTDRSGAILRSDFNSRDGTQRRREIQAVRRQEARSKREEKLKKSRGQNGNFAFVEDRLFLEAQRMQARVLERKVRERESSAEEVARKAEKINGADNELHLCLYPKVQHSVAWGPNVAMECESEQSNGVNEGGWNRKTASFERSSSPVSDYLSTSQKGGNISDTGSHSSPSHGRYQNIPQSKYEPESNGSSSQPEPFTRNSNPSPHFNQNNSNNNDVCSVSNNPAAPPGIGPTDRPPRPPNHNNLNVNAATPVPHMPRVSATGNGPNGRTITGFLYKYTKAEVSIMCVCHGTSFSPAEFVEHAGGVDVSHPLRHITIVPAAFR